MSVGKVTLEGYKCERCGHVWVPRKYETSQKKDPCPKCKSPYWTRQDVKNKKIEFKEKRKLRRQSFLVQIAMNRLKFTFLRRPRKQVTLNAEIQIRRILERIIQCQSDQRNTIYYCIDSHPCYGELGKLK